MLLVAVSNPGKFTERGGNGEERDGWMNQTENGDGERKLEAGRRSCPPAAPRHSICWLPLFSLSSSSPFVPSPHHHVKKKKEGRKKTNNKNPGQRIDYL